MCSNARCLGLGGYLPRLLFWASVPPTTAGVILLFFSAKASLCQSTAGPTIVEQAAPWLLRAMFFLYPAVANVAFQAFACHKFDDGTSWLVADVAVDCTTVQYQNIKVHACP